MEDMEETDRKEQKLRAYAEAVVFYMEHPEAINDEVTKAYVENIKKMLGQGQKQLIT